MVQHRSAESHSFRRTQKGLSEKNAGSPFSRLLRNDGLIGGMKRKPAAPVFKPYTMAQPQLLPPSLDELIEPDHLVRVVNAAIDQLDLRPLLAQYPGGRKRDPLPMSRIMRPS